jgi:hypothetical protein
MTKPHDLSCDVDACPVCGRPGEGVEYMPVPEDRPVHPNQLEFVVNHCINGQAGGTVNTAVKRNRFCRTGIYRDAEKGEIITSQRSHPHNPPDWRKIKKQRLKRG